MQPHRCVGRERFRESMANIPREAVDALFDCRGQGKTGVERYRKRCGKREISEAGWKGETKDEDGVWGCGKGMGKQTTG